LSLTSRLIVPLLVAMSCLLDARLPKPGVRGWS
jgi:hypothetical protein